MGMFNSIKTKRKCPTCKAKVQWQSKRLLRDGCLIENLLYEITLDEHMDGEMHAFCDRCGAAVEVTITKGKETAIGPRRLFTSGPYDTTD